jgi:hypothetical protein
MLEYAPLAFNITLELFDAQLKGEPNTADIGKPNRVLGLPVSFIISFHFKIQIGKI